MSTWPTVCVGDVLEKSESWIPITPEEKYKEVTVKLWGRGVSLRGVKEGSEIGSSRRLQVAPGQFIVSRIDARHGAFGLIPESLNGAVVTNDFPVFIPKPEQLSAKFLDWLSKTHGFVDACKKASEGTTNRVRLKEDRFKKIKIALPPIDEQQHIVNKIEALHSKICKAKQLRESILSDAQAMLHSAFEQIIEGAEYRPMAEVAPIVRRKVEVDIDGEYPELGARSFGKGIFHKPTLLGAELEWQKLFTVHKGDLVISNIKAWEGAIASAGENDHGRVGSHRYITCVPQKDVTTSDFLCFYLLTNEGLEKIQTASPGSADRNRTLAMKRLEKIEVPVPDYDKQLWFNQLQHKVEKIKQAQAENEVEVEALMPSILDKAFRGELL